MKHSGILMGMFAVTVMTLTVAAPKRALAEEVSEAQLQQFMTELEPEFKDPKKPEINKKMPIRGKLSAPILLVEYSDFQCPYCKKGFETVEALRQKYGKKLAFIFKNLPLPFHPLALPAAKHFVAIALQNKDKAWKFHDAVFQNQSEFTSAGESYLDDLAKKLKVNVAKMKKDMDSQKVSDILAADKKEADAFGFSGTPGFLVNGVRIKGAYPVALFEKVIDRELAEKAEKPKAKKTKVKKEKKTEEKKRDEKISGETKPEDKKADAPKDQAAPPTDATPKSDEKK